MIKCFTYNISKFKGYRLKIEQSNFKCYSKLKIEGFHVIESYDTFFNYSIDSQLIRKLKLKKINNLIRDNSDENRLLELLNMSKEYEIIDNNTWMPNVNYSYWSSSQECEYYDEDPKYNKLQNKYQSKIHSQRAKQYENKARFRK